MSEVDPKNPQESIELLKAIFKLVETGQNVMADGKIGITDIPAIVGVAIPLVKGIMGAEKIDDEILCMDVDGQAKFAEAIAEFEIPNEAIERLTERSINALVELAQLANDFVQVIKAKKETPQEPNLTGNPENVG